MHLIDFTSADVQCADSIVISAIISQEWEIESEDQAHGRIDNRVCKTQS